MPIFKAFVASFGKAVMIYTSRNSIWKSLDHPTFAAVALIWKETVTSAKGTAPALLLHIVLSWMELGIPSFSPLTPNSFVQFACALW